MSTNSLITIAAPSTGEPMPTSPTILTWQQLYRLASSEFGSIAGPEHILDRTYYGDDGAQRLIEKLRGFYAGLAPLDDEDRSNVLDSLWDAVRHSVGHPIAHDIWMDVARYFEEIRIRLEVSAA